MLTWKNAYEMNRNGKEFKAFFGKRSYNDFTYQAFCQRFDNTLQAATLGGGAVVPAPSIGPSLMAFPGGAVILGVTSAANQLQTTTGGFQYAPENEDGGSFRDLYALEFAYDDDTPIVTGVPPVLQNLPGSQGLVPITYALGATAGVPATPDGPVFPETLMRGGDAGPEIFPLGAFVCGPGNGLLCTVKPYNLAPFLIVHVVYHCMVPSDFVARVAPASSAA